MVKARALYLEEVLDMASLKGNPLYPKNIVTYLLPKEQKGMQLTQKRKMPCKMYCIVKIDPPVKKGMYLLC